MSIWGKINLGDLADVNTLPGDILLGVVFILIAWLAGRALRLGVQRVLARDKHNLVDRTAVNFMAQLTRIGVYIFAFICYAHIVPALFGLGHAWLASVGVISVIVGLAAQNTFGNLIAGISLLLYRPFNLGDRLQVTAPTGLETGTVESLTLGYTLLRTDDNRRVVIPNSVMASQTTVNLTGVDRRAVCLVPINLSFDADIDKARVILLELAGKSSKAHGVIDCLVTQLSSSGVVLTLEAWCPDAPTAGLFKSDLLEQAKKRFAAEGIKIT